VLVDIVLFTELMQDGNANMILLRLKIHVDLIS
jgi:hypothetical protein